MNLPIIVLVEPSHPGNIGATARAMKTMGHTQLRLVNPRSFPDPVANRRAAGAEDILQQAQCYNTLEAALADCQIIFATSNRPRTLQWPVYSPEDAVSYCADYPQHTIALVMGRESNGLSNTELNQCHGQITIPTHSAYRSLNLAQAVQILTYCFSQNLKSDKPLPIKTLPTHETLSNLHAHWARTLTQLPHFNMPNPQHTLNRLQCLINRAQPDQNEVNLLRGILSAVDECIGN